MTFREILAVDMCKVGVGRLELAAVEAVLAPLVTVFLLVLCQGCAQRVLVLRLVVLV